MSFKIKELKSSATLKRHDLEVFVSPLFDSDFTFQLRIISKEPIEPGDLKPIVGHIVDKHSPHPEKTKMVALQSKQGNAYINPRKKGSK